MIGRWYLLLIVLCSGSLCGQGPETDFLTADIRIQPQAESNSLTGTVVYRFLSSGTTDSLFLDARNMELQEILLDKYPTPFRYDGARISIPVPNRAGDHNLSIRYRCQPRQTVYFIGWEDKVEGNEQIWTQGQGKYSSHWVPSFDDMREKVIFDLQVQFDSAYTVVANGILNDLSEVGEKRIWSFGMQQPMSSYLLAFAIGTFDSVQSISGSGIPLELYYPKGMETEAAYTYRFSREIFDFLEGEIGIPYPWRIYKQVPVEDFLYAGMENTTATFFSSDYLVDSLGFADRTYVNINAHELAHQWFGNLVTEVDGSSHWLHEGFASYYAQLAEIELFGQEEIFWKLYRSARQLELLDSEGKGTSLLDPASSSLIFYEKGAWALWALRESIGEVSFREGIRRFLGDFAYSSAIVPDFLKVMETVSGQSLAAFSRDWLESRTFPLDQGLEFLASRSPSLAYYLTYSTQPYTPETFAKAWEVFDIPQYRAALITHFGSQLTRLDLERAFGESHPEVLKALLGQLGPLEEWTQPFMVALLEGPGYEVREAALYKLWTTFPDERVEYLERTFANGSMASELFSQIWHLLAAFTPDFRTPEERASFLDALRATTAPGYSREVRRNGFSLLQEIDGFTPANIRDLAGATEHHSWQFRIFARRLLDALMASRPDPDFWRTMAQSFTRESHPYLYTKIREL